MIRIAAASIRSRIAPTILVIIALTTSMALLLAVDRIQDATKRGFNQSLSGVDLVLGPRGSGIELILYTVFHLGKPTNNITTETLKDIESNPLIEWAIPIALGDSHRGFRVISTTQKYFDHIQFGGDQPLTFEAGQPFNALNDVVIGSTVADELGYSVGSSIFVTHGSEALGKVHDDFAFKVSGILNPTGTKNLDVSQIPKERLYPKTITAAYLGLSSKLNLFKVSRSINEYAEEAVNAVIPGVALAELWSMLGSIDIVFRIFNWLIIAISLIGMVTMTLTGLDSRTREMTILRALGATPANLASMVLIETAIVSITAVLLAIGLVRLLTWGAADFLSHWAGVRIDLTWINFSELSTLMTIVLAGLCASLIPAVMVYRRSLARGFSH
jgi:putative ABC transport system permease protein